MDYKLIILIAIGAFAVLVALGLWVVNLLFTAIKEMRGTAQNRQVDIAGQPLSVEVKEKPKRFSFAFWDGRHTEHEKRIVKLEESHVKLGDKMQTDKEELMKAGEKRKDELQKQISELPSKIIADLANAKNLTTPSQVHSTVAVTPKG